MRALAYQFLIEHGVGATAVGLASYGGLEEPEVLASLRRLENQHLLALTPDGEGVSMAHPFSGIETQYKAIVGEMSWYANCAWDSLAILGLMGDGIAVGSHLEPDLEWRVVDEKVIPDGLIHMVVPASRFWEDVGFT